MTARVCGSPGCPELTPCPHHARKPWGNVSPRNATRPPDAMERRARVRERDEGVCYWCGLPNAHHVDHVVSVSDGGTWDESNLAVMHDACHADKTQRERSARETT